MRGSKREGNRFQAAASFHSDDFFQDTFLIFKFLKTCELKEYFSQTIVHYF